MKSKLEIPKEEGGRSQLWKTNHEVLTLALQVIWLSFLNYFSVRPPKKSWKKIFNLSGGEKTLSSLALVFALHHYKPTPLYFMDEIDAALDFKNVSIVAFYIYVSDHLGVFVPEFFDLFLTIERFLYSSNCMSSGIIYCPRNIWGYMFILWFSHY